jgi:hypothetical protein
MVNRSKREIAVNVIQRVLEGKMPGDRFLDEFPRDKTDPALGAIYERLWFCFDDRNARSLCKDRADYDQVCRLLERCREFLRTDLEYDWPSKFRAPISLLLLRLVGARRAARKIEQREMTGMTSFGSLEEWPFHPGQKTTT